MRSGEITTIGREITTFISPDNRLAGFTTQKTPTAASRRGFEIAHLRRAESPSLTLTLGAGEVQKEGRKTENYTLSSFTGYVFLAFHWQM